MQLIRKQANLDVSYIEKRYAKGKVRVETWMDAFHVYHLNPKGLSVLHAEMIQHRRVHGPESG